MKASPAADFGTPRLWNVCFVGRTRVKFIDRFLAPGFRHVFMLGYVAEFGAWLLYDVQFRHTTIAIVTRERAATLIGIAMAEGDVLTFAPILHVKSSPLARIGFWCVPAARHLLGARCVALTPRGLHRYLVRMGAKSLKTEEDGQPVLRTESPD